MARNLARNVNLCKSAIEWGALVIVSKSRFQLPPYISGKDRKLKDWAKIDLERIERILF